MKIKRRKKKKILVILILLLLFISYLAFSHRQIKQKSNERIVVFVLDAGDWRIINKLFQEGKLSNLKYLVDRGVSGPLLSVTPIYTPPNMASLFTGKLPSQHGIKSHFDISDGNTKNQLYRNMNATPLWGILKGNGVTVDLVGFQEFDYAPRIDGTIVTGLYLIKKVAAHNDYLSNGKNDIGFLRYIPGYPLVSKTNGDILRDYSFLDNSSYLMQKNNLSLDFDNEVANSMSKYIIERLKETEGQKKGNLEFSKMIQGLESFFESKMTAKFVFEYDMLSKEIAEDLYKNHKSNILFVYFSGTDVFSHNYYFDGWHLKDYSNQEHQIYSYYEIIDGYIGEFIQGAGDDARFFVISDHGAQDMDFDKYITEVPHPPPHTQHGIFIAKGKNIKKGYKINNAAIFDITPTILYMYDQPIADDFDGTILYNIFEPEYVKNKTIKSMPSYD